MNYRVMPLLMIAAAAGAATVTRPDSQALISAIQHGSVAKVKAELSRGADPNVRDADGTPALIHAALYADAQVLQLLLDRGADPNATNGAGATALIVGAGDAAKARALVAKGADVNARSKLGRTPLMTAAAQDGAFEAVKLLVDQGAGVNAADAIPDFALGGPGSTPLMIAARGRDSRTVRYLLSHGAKAGAQNAAGATALIAAARQGSLENVKLLLAAGADPNSVVKSEIFGGFTALSWAAALDRPAVVEALIAAGAGVNLKDAQGNSPLTWAAMSERGDGRVVAALLRAGADPNVKGAHGETPASWAARRGATPIAALLGAKPETAAIKPVATAPVQADDATLRIAIDKSVAALLPAGPKFFKVSGCASCHNNSLPVMAARMARDRSIPVNQDNVRQQANMVKGMMKPAVEPLVEATDAVPDTHVSGAYLLAGLAAGEYQADHITAALVHNIATKQLSDGSWPNYAPRAPMENGDLQATVFAMRALQLYELPGRRAEFQQRVERAREWLRRAQPVTTEEFAMKLMGLHWSGAKRSEVEAAGRAALAIQRADGGWAQLTTLASDAYATGRVLVALKESGVVSAAGAAYRRGVAYLLATQFEDGSWAVKTRAFPFQPLKDSGFPHGRDQWISAAATSWASMALSYALDEAPRAVAAK